MKKSTRTALTVPALCTGALLLGAAPAFAAEGSVQADLTPIPVNGVDGSGTATVEVSGTTVSFTLEATGLLADAPHAAHIHVNEQATKMCPTEAGNTAAAVEGETAPEQYFTTSEGAPFYGGIMLSLTTEGDTSPDSGLAIDRFATGSDISYSRGEVEVTEDLAESILAGEAVVVVHGVDHNGSGAYDLGDRGVSDLDPSLPGEATDPALCGVLMASQMAAMPEGGVSTGSGGTAGVENVGLIAAGGVALLGGAALVLGRRRAGDG